MFWGIPYVSNHHKQARGALLLRPESPSFLHSLEWFYKTPSKRCAAFPSRSWAGWFDAARTIYEPWPLTTRNEIWMSRDCRLVGTEFSMCLERVDGSLIDWTLMTAQPYMPYDIREMDLSRLLRFVTRVGRILPTVSDKCVVYSLEPKCTGDDTSEVTINMDVEGYSSNTHEMYALS